MKNDNKTPISAKNYDQEISNTIPYYKEFYLQTLSIVDQMNLSQINWLDLGCGTGTLEIMARKIFSNVDFTMVDPSKEMLKIAKEKNSNSQTRYICASSNEINFNAEFNVVTAIQSHHYMKEAERKIATQNVYRALQIGGIYITFENVVPESLTVKNFELNRWGKYQLEHGKSKKEVNKHLSRCNVNYFPLTINQHLTLLRSTGFKEIHLFWYSYMQMGIYAIK